MINGIACTVAEPPRIRVMLLPDRFGTGFRNDTLLSLRSPVDGEPLAIDRLSAPDAWSELRARLKRGPDDDLVACLREGDAVFGHWAASLRALAAGAPGCVVRLRFARQRANGVSIDGRPAPRAETAPIRQSAEAYSSEEHAVRCATAPGSWAAPAGLLRRVLESRPERDDLNWALLVGAARLTRVVDGDEIGVLVRAYCDEDWTAWEGGRFASVPTGHGASLAARLRARLRGRSRRAS